MQVVLVLWKVRFIGVSYCCGADLFRQERCGRLQRIFEDATTIIILEERLLYSGFAIRQQRVITTLCHPKLLCAESNNSIYPNLARLTILSSCAINSSIAYILSRLIFFAATYRTATQTDITKVEIGITSCNEINNSIELLSF